MASINNLLEIMERLRDPHDGCPWDREQTFSTVAPYTVEEAYEVADAIQRNDPDDLRDELGDLLFQVVFHAQMAREEGDFSFEDVVATICDKMVRRHPHVFGSEEERRQGAVAGSWEAIKDEERAQSGSDSSALDGVAIALPALKRAEKLGKRAARVGFDWPDSTGVIDKITEEATEVANARRQEDPSAIADELGDLLFAMVNLARHLQVDPEQALGAANRKFERRFRHMERQIRQSGGSVEAMSLDELEACWQSAKASTASD